MEQSAPGFRSLDATSLIAGGIILCKAEVSIELCHWDTRKFPPGPHISYLDENKISQAGSLLI